MRQYLPGHDMDNRHADPVIDFAAILCSRLCHDLVSPVGALANGIEILAEEEDPDIRAQVLTLLEDSARQTASRLQFFRLAFGAGGGFGAQVDLREARKATDALLEKSKVKALWQHDEGLLPKDAVKLVLNLLLLASETMVRGGELNISVRQQAGTIQCDIVAQGDRIIFNDTVRLALTTDMAGQAIDPRCAPARLAYMTAAQLGTGIAVGAPAEGQLAFSVAIPAGQAA
ncbi:MAG: hypothetical protein Tsb0016_11740 [Sphingomonadales bacterium]